MEIENIFKEIKCDLQKDRKRTGRPTSLADVEFYLDGERDVCKMQRNNLKKNRSLAKMLSKHTNSNDLELHDKKMKQNTKNMKILKNSDLGFDFLKGGNWY